MTIGAQPASGRASFLQFPISSYPDPYIQLDVSVPPQSTAWRAVYVTSIDLHALVPVSVVEITALNGTPVRTMVNLNQDTLAALMIQVPTVTEQNAISVTLSDVDALLNALDRLIVKKRDLKQAAMQKLLTGQTRLPGFSAASGKQNPWLIS